MFFDVTNYDITFALIFCLKKGFTGNWCYLFFNDRFLSRKCYFVELIFYLNLGGVM